MGGGVRELTSRDVAPGPGWSLEARGAWATGPGAIDPGLGSYDGREAATAAPPTYHDQDMLTKRMRMCLHTPYCQPTPGECKH